MINIELTMLPLLLRLITGMTTADNMWAAIIVGAVSWIIVFGGIKVIRNFRDRRKLGDIDSKAKASPNEDRVIIEKDRGTVAEKIPSYEVTLPVSSQQLNSDEVGKTDARFKEMLAETSKQKEALKNLKGENLFTEDELNEKLKLLERKESEIREEQQELLIRKQAEPAVNTLLTLLKSGIITEEEYNRKKELAYINIKNELNRPPKTIADTKSEPHSEFVEGKQGNPIVPWWILTVVTVSIIAIIISMQYAKQNAEQSDDGNVSIEDEVNKLQNSNYGTWEQTVNDIEHAIGAIYRQQGHNFNVHSTGRMELFTSYGLLLNSGSILSVDKIEISTRQFPNNPNLYVVKLKGRNGEMWWGNEFAKTDAFIIESTSKQEMIHLALAFRHLKNLSSANK